MDADIANPPSSDDVTFSTEESDSMRSLPAAPTLKKYQRPPNTKNAPLLDVQARDDGHPYAPVSPIVEVDSVLSSFAADAVQHAVTHVSSRNKNKVSRPSVAPEYELFHSIPPISPKNEQIYCGDSLALMKQWPDAAFDACITDPPYNIAQQRKGLAWAFSSHVTVDSEWDRFTSAQYEDFTAEWLREVCRITKKNGNLFIFGSYHNIYTIGAIAQRMNLRIVNSIVWAKPNAQPNITCRMFTESVEHIVWVCNNDIKRAKNWTYNYQEMKLLNHNKQMRNYWEIPIAPQREREHGKHPTQKPLMLMDRLIVAGTNPGDRVLDCFAGSGSTLLSCDKLDRRWVGIEREHEYCSLARARLDSARRQRRGAFFEIPQQDNEAAEKEKRAHTAFRARSSLL